MLDCGGLPVGEQPALYAGVMGSAWLELAEPIRVAHASTTVRARGRLRIGHGRGPAARWLARLLGLPRANDAAETRLVITPDAGGELWRRTFDERRLDTRQYRAGDGELAERFGVLELRFRLDASQGSLVFRQTEAAFLCGTVRLRIPAVLAPRVDAREDPAGARQVSIRVRVVLPAVGPVLTYDGTIDIDIEETGA
ncbi:MAG TPA: DUF4166 domain-containing protein [Vicinamibacterales bacterium]